ncbi:cellulose biosynthesis protein BcsN [Microvirga alba]|uniref:Cellulose biosynthesis protein BcsN n=1 Tax=Microvirga alba TaxID=2791025 RepID=A0A931BU48_9HYPH|nr:cellulose biosynthesis protein BcsN [Microvirga alba]MBF9235200.1 cellulose biosynthesis protein BcsN [Microvirga alba]
MRSDLRYTALTSEVSAAQAIILPPPGGVAVIAVLQKKYVNGVSQEIALSTASRTTGQNAFYVSLISDSTARSDIDDTLKLSPLTQERIQTEMDERLPGIDMRTSLFYVQNKYGPFGYATGRSAAGDVCLYAWQQIEPSQGAFFVTSGAVSVRLRLCDADTTEEQLLRTMYAYTISAYFSSDVWNPNANIAPPPVQPQLGQFGAPMYPTGMGPYGTISTPPSPRRAPVTRIAPRPKPVGTDLMTAPPAPELAPLSGYPIVPPPPSQ